MTIASERRCGSNVLALAVSMPSGPVCSFEQLCTLGELRDGERPHSTDFVEKGVRWQLA